MVKDSAARTTSKPNPEAETPAFSAFTVQADGRMAVLLLDIRIGPVSPPGKKPLAEAIHKCRAAWNTGIQRSRISDKMIRALGLQPDGRENGKGPERYPVDIYLPNKIRFTPVFAERMDAPDVVPPVDCIIGMDVIRHGDCSISHQDGKTMFSFRVPALGGVDYVKLAPTPARRDVVTVAARRNQMCPCGSGRRYKNCCGKLA